jgi:beta-aspartyl-peptidase (threonine type)
MRSLALSHFAIRTILAGLVSLVSFSAFAYETDTGVVLAIHGGYAPDKPDLTPELKASFCADMQRALMAGANKLNTTKNSMDAVEAAIVVLEDSPHFNAGRGSVFTHEGKVELDASIMEGKDKKAGAIASITTAKNPILAARAVMEHTPHVLLVGQGADDFCKEQKLELVDQEYYKTERRWKQHLGDLEKEKSVIKKNGAFLVPHSSEELGTVGAVALDANGNLAAGTSTGGLSNKKHGRVGDSPIIGAGTYADNEGVALSATGHGEYFIRFHVASAVNDLVKLKKMPLKAATHHVLFNQLNEKAGEGGVIALDRKGNASLEANSEGMLRGYVKKGGKMRAFVYNDECKF